MADGLENDPIAMMREALREAIGAGMSEARALGRTQEERDDARREASEASDAAHRTALRDWGTVEQHQALGTPTGGSMYAIQLYALAVAGPPALVRMILTAYGVTAQEIDGEGEGPASVGTTGG